MTHNKRLRKNSNQNHWLEIIVTGNEDELHGDKLQSKEVLIYGDPDGLKITCQTFIRVNWPHPYSLLIRIASFGISYEGFLNYKDLYFTIRILI